MKIQKNFQSSHFSAMDSDSDGDETMLVRRYAGEYSRETSIHGIKYVGESNRTTLERSVLC